MHLFKVGWPQRLELGGFLLDATPQLVGKAQRARAAPEMDRPSCRRL
jgi:hypothetical protein